MSHKRTLTPAERELLTELALGAKKAFENAEALFKEAQILKDNGALSRAVFLHQISMEECGKAEMLGWWATAVLMGHEINLAKLATKLANHKSKNYANAYMLPRSDEEWHALQRGDFNASAEAFAKRKAQFHEESNTAKNASLYVDFMGDKFVAPVERITEPLVEVMATNNWDFLRLMQHKVEMLSRWQHDPDGVAATTVGFEAKLKTLLSSDDPVRAFSIFVDEITGEADTHNDDVAVSEGS